MRTFRFALFIFCLLLLIIVANAVYIRNVGKNLISMLDKMPTDAVNGTTDAAKIRAYWEKALPIVNISVGYCETDRFEEALISLELYAQDGNNQEYHQAIELAKNASKDLMRLEYLSAMNIF